MPRCWTIILAQLAGHQIADEIPKEWQVLFKQITGLEAPKYLHDKDKPQISQLNQDRVGSIVSESVSRVQNLIFPLLSIENP